MNRRTPPRRAIRAALICAALLATAPAATASAAQQIPERVCDHRWRDGTWHVRQLIRCAARRWDPPGSPRYAVTVARCESDLRPKAYNPGGYAGLFQQATRYWPTRAVHYGQADRSVYNARANVIVSIRMAASANSWSAWAGCA